MCDFLPNKSGKFFLCVAGTETSDIPGISAAGSSPESRRLTPALDAEALIDGRAHSCSSVPVSPRGIVSPVVITRACLQMIGMPIEIVDCGTFSPPQVSAKRVGSKPSGSVSSGHALSLEEVQHLFEAGKKAGAAVCEEFDYVVLGECVPGGTTTALAVLTALGWNVSGMLSSSTPVPQHDLKYSLVSIGLERAGLLGRHGSPPPLTAVAAVGDPMQPFVAGFALTAMEKIPVILAGGSQMLAVFALMKALSKAMDNETRPRHLPIVVTTKWVAFDPGAKSSQLASMISAPYMAACPDFHQSMHPGLQAYEEGNVKEGVGAGAALFLAHAQGRFTETQILRSIDRVYLELVGNSGAQAEHNLAPAST